MGQNCLAGCGLALVLGLLARPAPQPGRADKPVPINSITVCVAAKENGKITATGTFTTAPKVTLRKVTVFALPRGGGLVPPPAALPPAGIDGAKKKWGTATLDAEIYNDLYAIRADAIFSDQSTVSSGYTTIMAGGEKPPEPNLKLSWGGGFPASNAAGTISCAGPYEGNPNADRTGTIVIAPIDGGGQTVGFLKLDKTAKGRWSTDPTDMPVRTGPGPHSAVCLVNDNGPNGGRTYCAPLAVTNAKP
jgi:hypothetical protein